MIRSSLALLVLPVLLLTACGVDTTGISAASSKQPEGPATASVTVTEYGDFQCPACKGAYDLINKPLLDKYGSKIRFVFKQFPLQGIHQYALEAAEASECAADQGKFWEFVDMDYAHQDDLSSQALRDWAKNLGLDTDLFERCLSSGIKKKAVLADFAEGEKLGVDSTPSYFVNGEKVKINLVTDLETAVANALQQTAAAPL